MSTIENGALTPRDTVTPVTVSGAVLGLLGAIITLLVAAGVDISPELVMAITGLVSAALIAVPVIVRRIAVARAQVVELASTKGLVTAGPANDLAPTGDYIRTLGEPATVTPVPNATVEPLEEWDTPD